MKIYEIVLEGMRDKVEELPPDMDDMDMNMGDIPSDDVELEPLETDMGSKEEKALIVAVRELIKDGASEIETDFLKNKVMDATNRPFKTADLVALFKNSSTLQGLIEKIDTNKVKFSTEILTASSDKGNVENRNESASIVRSMANRAIGKR